MKLQFNDSHESDGFEEAIDAVNKLLEPHYYKIERTFTADDEITDYAFEWKLELRSTHND